MSITIELAPDLEQQVRQAAAQAGLSPDTYIVETIRRLLQPEQHAQSSQQLSPAETTLLLHINDSLSGIAWARYHELGAKRQSQILTEDEQRELIDLSDQIEIANARRIGYALELAHLRNTSLDSIMRDLGLQSPSHA